MKLKFLLFNAGIFFCGQVFAEKMILSDVQPPKDLEDIHVVKIGSDIYSTDFVIFVKDQVPLHKHVEHSETIYVLEGKGLFQFGDDSFEIMAGDYIRVPKGVPHAVKVLSTMPLKIISVQAPEFFGKDRVKVN